MVRSDAGYLRICLGLAQDLNKCLSTSDTTRRFSAWIGATGMTSAARAGNMLAGLRMLSVQRREPCGEVPQLPGLGYDAHAGQLGGPAGHPGDDFDHIVEVALGVGAAGDGETD